MSIVYQPATHCSFKNQIGLELLRDYFMAQGTVALDNGIQMCRPVRGGSTLSTHAEGRAWDAVWKTNEALQAAIAFLYEHREALQIQEIIDYRAGRRWASNTWQWLFGGWRKYTLYGASGWSSHFARNWQGALDQRSIEQVVAEVDGMPLTLEEIDAIAELASEKTVEKLGVVFQDLDSTGKQKPWELKRRLRGFLAKVFPIQ